MSSNVTVVRTPTIDYVNNQIASAVFPGTINQYAGSVLPSGWFWCDGAEYSISLYPNLYNTLTSNGSTFPYGTNTNGSGGAGSTHFRVPNLKGRFVVGRDSTVVNFDTLGETGGALTHTHTIDATGSSTHNHTVTASSAATNTNSALTNHTHNVSTNGSNTGTAGGHSHNSTVGASNSNATVTAVLGSSNRGVATSSHTHGFNTGTDGDHTHTVNGQSGGTGDANLAHSHSVTINVSGNTDTNGGAHTHTVPTSQASSSLPPYITLNYIIKY